MTTADDVRRVGLALPRAYEFIAGGRAKLKVRQTSVEVRDGLLSRWER